MSLAAAVAWLSGVLVTAWIIQSGCFNQARDVQFVRTTAMAAAIAWVSGVLALASTVLLTRAKQPLTAVLSGVLFRTGIPLLGLLVGTALPSLAEAGLPGQIVVFFLVMLATETVLALKVTGTSLKFLWQR